MAAQLSTVEDMANKVLRSMTGFYQHEFATTAATMTAQDTSVAFTAGHAAAMGLGIGDVVEIGSEQMLVEGVSTDTITLSRGWQGTIAAAHASGDMVKLHPRIGRQDIYDAMEQTILGWSDLWTPEHFKATADFSAGTSRSAEILGAPEDFVDVLKIRYQNEQDMWVSPPRDSWTERDIVPMASGLVLQWESPFYPSDRTTNSVDVWLSVPFDTSTFEPTTDLVEEIGLTRSMLSTLFHGTMYLTLLPEETQRAMVDASPSSRDAQEVPPGYLAQTALSFRVLHDQGYNVEVAKLKRRWTNAR
jgi:hypothetical protein